MRQWLLTIVLGFAVTSQLAGQNWAPLRGGVGVHSVRVMYADTLEDYLYVAGLFHHVDGIPAKGITRWNGSYWDTLGAGIDGMDTLNLWPKNTYAISRYQGELLVGGVFKSAGDVAACKLARWNGIDWDSLPVQPFVCPAWNSSINSLEVIDDHLFVGGSFDTIAGVPCVGVAKWDGANWDCIGMPPNMHSTVYVGAICEYQGEVYIGGNFYSDAFPNDTIMDIIRYDGSRWRSVGGGMQGLLAGISSMVVYRGELCVAGYFFKADGNAGNHIQRWNGSEWRDVGGGTGGENGQIHKLLVHDDKLYAMGVLQMAGGVQSDRIAVWDGTDWCGLGSTFDNVILTGAIYRDTLYVGDGFRTIDGDSISRVAKWIGGDYVDQCGHLLDSRSAEQEYGSLLLHPNPATTHLNITAPFNSTITIHNLQGQQLLTTKDTTIPIAHLPPGLYLLQACGEWGCATSKFVKQ